MSATQARVRDTMTPHPHCIGPDMSVIEAARIMRQEDVGSLPVCEGDRLLGMVTDRDIVLRVVAEGKNPQDLPVGGVASREFVTVKPDERLDEALRLMARHQVRRLPVVEEGQRLVGIVAQADVARRAPQEETGEVVQQISEPTD